MRNTLCHPMLVRDGRYDILRRCTKYEASRWNVVQRPFYFDPKKYIQLNWYLHFPKFKMSYTLLLRKKRLYCSCIPVALFKMVYKPEYSWPQYMGHHPEQHFTFANPAQLPWWGPCESSVRLTEYCQGVKENKLKAKLMLDQLRQSSNSWYMWEKWYSKITKQLQAFESYWKR